MSSLTNMLRSTRNKTELWQSCQSYEAYTHQPVGGLLWQGQSEACAASVLERLALHRYIPFDYTWYSAPDVPGSYETPCSMNYQCCWCSWNWCSGPSPTPKSWYPSISEGCFYPFVGEQIRKQADVHISSCPYNRYPSFDTSTITQSLNCNSLASWFPLSRFLISSTSHATPSIMMIHWIFSKHHLQHSMNIEMSLLSCPWALQPTKTPLSMPLCLCYQTLWDDW